MPCENTLCQNLDSLPNRKQSINSINTCCQHTLKHRLCQKSMVQTVRALWEISRPNSISSSSFWIHYYNPFAIGNHSFTSSHAERTSMTLSLPVQVNSWIRGGLFKLHAYAIHLGLLLKRPGLNQKWQAGFGQAYLICSGVEYIKDGHNCSQYAFRTLQIYNLSFVYLIDDNSVHS